MTPAQMERRSRELYDDCENVVRIDLCRRIARLESLCGDLWSRLESAGAANDARLRSELRLMGVVK